MSSIIFTSSCIFIIIALLFNFQTSHSFTIFKCLNKKGNAPRLPPSYSANIRINFLVQQYSVEMKYATIEGKELIEFISKGRHVKYITREDQGSVLFIQYKEDEHPTCKVTKLKDKSKAFLEDIDAGEDKILLKTVEIMMFPDKFNIYAIQPSVDTGVFAEQYEGCLSEPKINISISFAGVRDWNHTHSSSLVKDVYYPEMVIAEIDNNVLTAFYSYFDPSKPDYAVFQPPADVYCAGFRADKTPPKIPDYFSYNAELIWYESAVGIAPLVSQRKVYYDFPSGITRMDFNDPLAEDPDLFSKVTAQKKSIIHDFNSGRQYIFDPFTGKCTIDTFQTTFSAISIEITKDNNMYTGSEYFWLNGAETSYNGQFPIRGMNADVYTATKVDPQTKKRSVVSWYFSTEETRVAENDNVEKNVLLRMYARPEKDMKKDGVVVINFYDFIREEPNVFTYDLTSCYNDSSSKVLVFTFPAIESLKGSEKLIGMLTHLAIKDTTGLRKQNIYMKEVIFSRGYMYAEFILLEESLDQGKVQTNATSLDDALKKLRDSVSNGDFQVKVPVGNKIIKLQPEPNGLNVFAGDRVKAPSAEGYKEGSVISLTIGMLVLGFVLGAVTLNLIVSRKFGVSLFQKGNFGNNSFNNPLNESSM